jgi:hypothetical protein
MAPPPSLPAPAAASLAKRSQCFSTGRQALPLT